MRHHIQESIDTKKAMLDDEEILSSLAKAINLIADCFERGSKILIAGNGGSAADAQHLAAEFVGRFKHERRGYPAIALTTDTSIITAWSNDYHFDTIFERQVEALGREGDVLVVFSTSGNSKNILKAIEKARIHGLKTLALLGCEGGKSKSMAHVEIIVPSNNTPRIQEAHVMLLHIIAEAVEARLVLK